MDEVMTEGRLEGDIATTLEEIEYLRRVRDDTRYLMESWPDAGESGWRLLTFARKALSRGLHLFVGRTLLEQFDLRYEDACRQLRAFRELAATIAELQGGPRADGAMFWKIVTDLRRNNDRIPSEAAICSFLGEEQ